MAALTLYQFALCPFCHKVRAGLELKGLAYRAVEVNPMTKKELPPLPADAPKKVPVLQHASETIFDSTTILAYLDTAFPDTLPFTPADPAARVTSTAIEEWVDAELIAALPTVIYGTWREAITAAQVTARSSNFGFFHNVSVRAGGSLIMHQISKRILKKHGKTDGHAWVEACMDRFETWLADQAFVTGSTVSLGDVAVHGALTCVAAFPIHAEIMRRPRVAAWDARMASLRTANRATS
ncbi:MAG: glutathione S-transferase family protein [Deltaproteobacteria bacterium]|nr:glutathione S-transferase family protein [Deltaproteobacteria bacterium]